MNNKKGLELIELMVITVIFGILAAAIIPKFMSMKCKSDIKACKVNNIEMYNSICSKDKNYKICYGEEKPKEVEKEVVKEVVHDTVYVVVDKQNKDTISMSMSHDKEECILQCQKDNVSKSLVDFCIKEKCK